jgi:predicted MPP superfamily phosphohydrolase
LIISGGLGESVVPVRLLRPPEIVEIVLGAEQPPLAQFVEW